MVEEEEEGGKKRKEKTDNYTLFNRVDLITRRRKRKEKRKEKKRKNFTNFTNQTVVVKASTVCVCALHTYGWLCERG